MKSLVGTGQLVRFILRRERLRLAIWVAVLALVPVGTANAFIGLYPSEAERAQDSLRRSPPIRRLCLSSARSTTPASAL